jgi:hypothetical protein
MLTAGPLQADVPFATFDVTVRLRLVRHPTGEPIPGQLLACATRLRYDET